MSVKNARKGRGRNRSTVPNALERNGKDEEGVVGGRIRMGKAEHCTCIFGLLVEN